MKFTSLLLVVLAVYTASAVPVNVLEQADAQFLENTVGDDVAMDFEQDADMEASGRRRNPDTENVYILFTRKNPTQGQILKMNDAHSIKHSHFNKKHETVVLVHGWLSDQESEMNPLITEAYLNKGDANVIVLDWRHTAGSINYYTAARRVPDVGKALARFLRFLSDVTKAPFSNMHLVGFSLGAHLVGNAGRELNGQIARITGLDPAGPLWQINSDRLNDKDAKYVEAIHTDGGLMVSLGIGRAIAQVDFFPNGGNEQPGCFTSICHHNRAWRLFAATVTHNHLVGRRCSGMVQVTLNSCRGAELHMGNSELTKSGSGIFRGNTSRRYPF